MGALSHVDEALARRLEAVSDRYMLEWLSGTSAELERFGGAVAAVDASRPELDFVNRVYGLWPEDADRVGAIVRRYREREVRGWLELAPSEGFERLAEALTRAGAAQIGFHSVLRGPPKQAEPALEVGEVRADDVGLFADVLLRGHGVPEPERARDPGSIERWLEIDGWRLYLARVEGQPAGAAVLTVGDGIGYLANTSTLSEYRGRGVQTALIARRLADASAVGVELVCSGTAFGSQSQRNLERAGLQVAYTKAVWRLTDRG
jgi:ribosomal protein S18 acetylase RimI-like enzyme